jgi:hypothetical protein
MHDFSLAYSSSGSQQVEETFLVIVSLARSLISYSHVVLHARTYK